ncbi:hypothetical protein SAMN04488543_3921 [Friedmanniella luteola]|uniref:FAR-17a/AIG1-like protein n=1 Tax=Friedmanniella luteola TaxID=546871 RepID=A0A1H1ZPU9_9ACTN|nr:Pr6Pr family membrane protein [Friedmanniella luteola]SDT35724.1 hypothetical protein SAMN04488543_3921 [Friedmanniella luteola]
MRSTPAARVFHGLTALVAAFALLAQLVLTVQGSATLVEVDPPGLAERLFHLVSYFTILSNLLVLATTVAAARDPHVDGPVWRVLRLDAVVAITITGIVHWFLLRPLLDLAGWSYAVDKLLHVAVPLLAVVGWVLFGPRRRVDRRVVLLALVYPFVWLFYTLVVGALTGWYPYPFLDVGANGAAAVTVAALGIAVFLFALSALVWWLDRLLGPAPRAASEVAG